jgi:hypothetical protein
MVRLPRGRSIMDVGGKPSAPCALEVKRERCAKEMVNAKRTVIITNFNLILLIPLLNHLKM